MSSRLPRYEALEKEDRIDEIKKKKKKKKSRSVRHLLQAQQAPVPPYGKVVGRPPRHCKLPSTIARHENGYSTSSVNIIISVNKIIVISCRKTVFNCQFHPFINVSSFYLSFLCFKNEIAHFLNIDRTEISADFCKTLSKDNQSALIRRITSNFTCRHSINIKTLQVFVFEMPYYMYTNYTIPCVGNCPVKGDFCYQRGILHGNKTANRDY